MSFERKFSLAGHGLALVGVAALATTDEVGGVYVWLAIASLVWSLWRGWEGRGLDLDSRMANGVTMFALAVIFLPVVLRGTPPIRAIGEFLLVLSALKGLVAKTNRDWLQVCVLSFFQLVSASALTVEPVFAGIFVLYLLLAPWVLVLFLLRREVAERGDPRRLSEEPFVDASLFRAVATVTVVLFVSTLVVFVFFPRMGAGFFANPLVPGARVTGFSDSVGLGDVTALKKDESVALRVSVDRPDAVLSKPRYWRGSALDSFDGRRWTRGPQDLRPLPRAAERLFLAGVGAPAKTLLREEVIAEPMDTPAVFLLGRPVHVRGGFSAVLADGLGNLRAAFPAGVRARYEILASLEPRDTRPTPRSRSLPELDPRIAELARARVAGIAGDGSRARALLAVLREGFTYTMEPGNPGPGDPIAHFLFDSRRGHCEYFASALAVMLRAVGIPSLVVNGYLGGEWNPYGGYFLLRQSDAHSWVEAYVDGRWQTFDPTPGAAAKNASPGWAALLDAYRMRWYRYVVNYSLNDQVEIALSLRGSSRRLWDGLSGEALRRQWREATSRGSAAAILWLAAAGMTVAAWMRRRVKRRKGAAELGRASLCYLAMLKALERRGLAKRPGETPDEFYRKIAPRLDGDAAAVERLTALYQEARFSGREGQAARARAEMDSLLETLRERV